MGEKTSETKKPEIQMIPVQYVPYCEEEEIDLKELIKKILARKYFILGFTFFVTLLGTIYAFFIAKPVYEVKTDIHLGYLVTPENKKITFLSLPLVVTYIKDTYDNTTNPNNKFPMVLVSKNKKSSNIISLSIQHISNQKALETLEKIIADLRKQERKHLNNFFRNLKNQLAIYENQQKVIANQISLFKQQLKSISSPAIYQIIVNTINKYQAQLFSLKLETVSLKNKLLLSIYSPPSYIGKIISSKFPIKPKKKLIVIVSFISGLIIAIFSIFLYDFWKEVIRED